MKLKFYGISWKNKTILLYAFVKEETESPESLSPPPDILYQGIFIGQSLQLCVISCQKGNKGIDKETCDAV